MARHFHTCSGASELFEDKYVAARRRPGNTLIIGSKIYHGRKDRRLIYGPPMALGVDMQPGDGVDVVCNFEDDLPTAWLGHFAHIECISVLEHAKRPWLLAANIQRALCDGGTLHVQAPFVWRIHGYPSDYWRFTIDGIRELFDKIKFHNLIYASKWMTPKNKIPSLLDSNGAAYFGRSEVCGIGEKIG